MRLERLRIPDDLRVRHNETHIGIGAELLALLGLHALGKIELPRLKTQLPDRDLIAQLRFQRDFFLAGYLELSRQPFDPALYFRVGHYLCGAIDKHGNPFDFLMTAKRDLDTAEQFFRKMLKDEPLLSPNRIGTDGANTFPSTIKMSVEDGLLHPDPVHYVTKHLQQGIESVHFRVKKNMPKIGGLQSFNTARRTILGFEATLWLRKGFGFSGGWTVIDQNDLLARLFGLHQVNKAQK